jgi:hypothetical protein
LLPTVMLLMACTSHIRAQQVVNQWAPVAAQCTALHPACPRTRARLLVPCTVSIQYTEAAMIRCPERSSACSPLRCPERALLSDDNCCC